MLAKKKKTFFLQLKHVIKKQIVNFVSTTIETPCRIFLEASSSKLSAKENIKDRVPRELNHHHKRCRFVRLL